MEFSSKMAGLNPITWRNRVQAIALSAAVGLLSGLQFWTNSAMEGYSLSIADVLVRHTLSWMSWGGLAPYLIRSARVEDFCEGKAKLSILRHGARSLAIALVHRPLHVWLVWYPFWGRGEPWDFVRDFTFFSFFTDVAIYWAIVGSTLMLGQRALLHLKDLKTAKLQGELSQSKLAVLEQQLRPHFLFNTLHALQVLQREGRKGQSIELVDKLSNMLRAMLRRGAPSEVCLHEEWIMCEDYIDLMRIRFGDRLTIESAIEVDAENGSVPRLILQPLIENAFLHGIEGRVGPGRIQIRAWIADWRLIVEIEDDGPGPGASTRSGEQVGLGSIQSRLQTIYGSDAGLDLLPGRVCGAIARLWVPYRKCDGNHVGEPA